MTFAELRGVSRSDRHPGDSRSSRASSEVATDALLGPVAPTEERFAIAFDLPDADGHLSGDPCFAGEIDWLGVPVPAFFPDLGSAQRFVSEDEAALFLRSVFSTRLQEFGVVVEVAA